jgi:hypothetical protein
VQLAVAVLAAGGLRCVGERLASRMRLSLGALFVALMVVESMPTVMATFPAAVPAWVIALRDAPAPGAAVFDAIDAGEPIAMYYQTIHQRPIAGGALARLPMDAYASAKRRFESVGSGQIDARLPTEFAYLVVGAGQQPLPFEVYYADRAAVIYRLDRPR